MDSLTISVVALAVVQVCMAFFVVRKTASAGLSKRALTLKHIASEALAYSKKQGGTPEEQMLHALSAARLADEKDNGKRDYSDSELRVAIESQDLKP